MHPVFFSSSDAHCNTSSGSQGIYPCVKTLHEPPPLSRTLTLRSHPQHDDHKHQLRITRHIACPYVKTLHEPPLSRTLIAHTHATMITTSLAQKHRSQSHSRRVVVRQNRPLETAWLSSARPAVCPSSARPAGAYHPQHVQHVRCGPVVMRWHLHVPLLLLAL